MNPHDDKKDEAKDEEQISSILKSADTNAAPPNAEKLAQLRAQASEAFAAPPVVPMSFFRRVRWFAAAAAAVIIGVGMYAWLAPGRSNLAFGSVLENSEKAETLHARLTVNRGLKQIEFWHSRQLNSSRADDLAGKYRIADDSRYWIINEAENEARRTKLPANIKRPVHHLLDELGVPSAREALLSARPVKRLRDGEQEVLLYQAEIPAPQGSVFIEALVVASTGRLHSLTARSDHAGIFGELTVIAYDEPIGAEKFAIADTLTEDGRIGKVTDVQGIVSLKPVLHDRWTPVRERFILRPGDWLRTDARGANATAIRLAKNTGVILGPKTHVELIGPKKLRLVEGQVEITPAAGTSIELLGPDRQKLTINGRQFIRVEKQQLARLAKDPPWLLGFKGATTNETLGSLIALVDGRNVPLTVGYHKVQVDIRDQVARTVIEESFVNHTDRELEGVFYFPLPQDASISGFGMWIGDKLVEADVVEKQRAREIYEQILRERKDPGLLEWSGGNIFKARVFPIAANSEKRIKITYTQVLPMKGNRYRYSYGLQSELLQQHPLKSLSIDVKVNSVAALKSVTSPTHPARENQTSHSAHVEFSAQQYTPTRDFEVVVETEGRQADVVMIPHRRGDDGYFMLQLTPPGATGNWERPLLPNGDPLHLLIVADTSASIDAGQRATQAAFIGSLFNSLTPKDTFNLATADVSCDWAFGKSMPADAANVSVARDHLAQRTSLGWSNLDAAFAAALKQCGPNTHVVYVGDGIVTTGDADPVAFTKRLRRLYQAHGASFHAVTLASSYEPAVVKAIASLGGGSMRKITSEQGPAVIAHELLGEIAQPALRDIKVEFKGFKAARVYPETLANVPAGAQQILMGRYLPEGKDQTGEVIVTGTQGGKAVRFSTRATLKDAEQGNSFLPRLWARMHLDSLLEQGSSERIKDEIIALSEEYQIITPFTSFLVLETDADRERFKVKRRFQMRDGERFFADARDNAVFDLAQKQMKSAGNWRTAMRRSVLSELARLGREPRLFEPAPHPGRAGSRLGGLNSRWGKDKLSIVDGTNRTFEYELAEPLSLADPAGAVPESSEDLLNEDIDNESLIRQSRQEDAKQEPAFVEGRLDPREAQDGLGREGKMLFATESPPFFGVDEFMRDVDEAYDEAPDRGVKGSLMAGEYSRRGPYYGQWLDTLFPTLPAAPRKPKATKSTWPMAARELAQSLLRTDKLAKLAGGLEITRTSESFDSRWGDLTARARRLELVAGNSWLTRDEGDGSQTLLSWCDAKEIGVYSKAFQFGRVRASTPADMQPPPLALDDHSMSSLELAFPGYAPTLEPQGKDRTLLILKYETSPIYETRILIDTARHVVLSIENRYKKELSSTKRFDDFVEVGGVWWARRVETSDKDGRRTALVTQSVTLLTQDDLQKQVKSELAGRSEIQFLHLPAPSVFNAKKALNAGKASFEDHFVLMLHFYRSQQWPRVLEHLQNAEKLAANKAGMRWLRSAVLRDSRKHDELQVRYLEDSKRLDKLPSEAYFLAEYIVGQSAGVMQANEMLALLDTLQPLYEKQPAQVNAAKLLRQRRVSYLNQTGRTDEALRLQKQLATDYPRDYSLQQQYAHALANTGDYPAAYAWLARVLVKDAKWLDHEEESLRTTYTQLLEQQSRFADLVAYLSAWVEQNPRSRTAYEQYLSALVRSDQIEKADAFALRWLKDAQVPGELAPAAEARLQAAVQFMLGNGHRLWTNRIEERFLAPLSEAALFFVRHEARLYTAGEILQHHRFNRSEEAPRVRKKLAAILTSEIDKLSPEQIRRFVRWISTDDVEPGAWGKMAEALRKRWTNETKDEAKHDLGYALAAVLAYHENPNELLAFLRVQLQTGPAKHRAEYANQLFERLLTQPWSAEIEGETFGLLDKLSGAEGPGARLLASVAALHRLTDRMIDNRIAASAKLLQHPEKLTRTELMKKQEEARKLAREGVADRLRKEAAKHPKALAQWLVAESLYLDVQLDRNLKQAADEAWQHLGAAPSAPPKETPEDELIERALERVLQQRYLITLTNLAARKNAAPALVEKLIRYHDAGIAVDANRWKAAKYRLLIALDRTKEIEQALQQWTRQEDPDSRWRVALGYLLAEQGRLPEAIQQFEAVEAADELSPNNYRALADWYLVQNRRDDHQRAAVAVYKTTPERYLSQMITAKLQPWTRAEGQLPTELDKEVLRQFAVLFDKSVAPHYYLDQLRQFYQASRDFRLLSGVPDAVVGHSAARVYPFVQGMKAVLDEVRDEATADEIVKRIAEVRPRAKTDVDTRALDMLEVLVERRAAEVQNQPGPHREKALAALVRVSKGAWSPGEPRLMADFLAELGKISQDALAKEQLKHLKALHSMAAPGSLDRLHIAHQYGRTLHQYDRKAAIDVLEAALNEFMAANEGKLPSAGEGVLATFVSYLENAGHYARGEKVLLAQLERPVHAEQRRWLIERVNRLGQNALHTGGETSLGKGAQLYQALNAKIQKDLADADQNQRYRLVALLSDVFRTAHAKKLPDVDADVRDFAFKVLPPILKEQTSSHESMISDMARVVRDVAGPRDGLVFLLNQIEREPRWLRYVNQDGWKRHAYSLSNWRREAKDLGADDEARLLKIVLAELRRDLETRESHVRLMYHRNVDSDRKHFWEAKAADFAKTAEAVLAERPQSGATARYVAEYFYFGLEQPKRAIDILFAAHKQKLLDDEGQATLVYYLHREERYGESIAVLLPMIERRPANLDYRVRLMSAYFHTTKMAELLALLEKTDAFFHEKDRWGEHPLSFLADSTLKNELFGKSVAYYKELIPLHERTQPGRGVGNGTLAKYYMGLAKAYAGLKKTPEAVDAASSAIVAWGKRSDNRAGALDTLRDVLLASPDLDGYVAQLDKRASEQKEDSAIIRKALGQAYQKKKEHAKAITQLELAAGLQANDAEIYEALVDSYDALEDKDGAIRQLLQAVQLSRREFKLYQKLGQRYTDAGQATEAERAYTSIVEMLPTESESHALLAEIREKQNRWPDAITHWEQVARLRALEPDGLLKLAAAQIHEKQWNEAAATLRKLDTRTWPQRFGDVHQKVRDLEEKLAKKRKSN